MWAGIKFFTKPCYLDPLRQRVSAGRRKFSSHVLHTCILELNFLPPPEALCRNWPKACPYREWGGRWHDRSDVGWCMNVSLAFPWLRVQQGAKRVCLAAWSDHLQQTPTIMVYRPYHLLNTDPWSLCCSVLVCILGVPRMHTKLLHNNEHVLVLRW